MTIVPTQVSYQPLRTSYGGPPEGIELHFLFLTVPNKPYLLRSTTDGITYKDEGPRTLAPNEKLVVTTNPKDGVWFQLVEGAADAKPPTTT